MALFWLIASLLSGGARRLAPRLEVFRSSLRNCLDNCRRSFNACYDKCDDEYADDHKKCEKMEDGPGKAKCRQAAGEKHGNCYRKCNEKKDD